jgi:hypothetical protein
MTMLQISGLDLGIQQNIHFKSMACYELKI